MPSVRAEPDPDEPLLRARILVEGLSAPPVDARFCLRREGYPTPNLGTGAWQVREERLQALAVRQEGGTTVLLIDARVAQHLEPGPYQFSLPAAGLEAPLFWPEEIDLLPQPWTPPSEPVRGESGTGETWHQPPGGESGHETTRPDNIGNVTKTGDTPPTSTKPGQGPGRGRAAALGGLVLLAVAAVLAWQFWPRGEGPATANQQESTVVPVTPPRPDPGSTPPPPSARSWLEGTDNLAPAEIARTAPNLAELHAAALRRQAAGRHDDALMLLETAAEGGHAPAMTSLARLYDPNGFRAGQPFSAPDPRNAARLYRDAAQRGDPAAEAPRAALKTYLEAQGSPAAGATLREFWP